MASQVDVIRVALEISNLHTQLDRDRRTLQAKFDASIGAARLQLEELGYHEHQVTGDSDDPLDYSPEFSTALLESLQTLKDFPEYTRFCEIHPALDFVSCVACDEVFRRSVTVATPCGHRYCGECMTTLFDNVTRDESMYPPRCCRQAIPLDSVRSAVDPDVAITFENKEEEFTTTDRTYCAVSTCLRFISPQRIYGNDAKCYHCGKYTCSRCKRSPHWGEPCSSDQDAELLLKLAEKEQWQFCSRCHCLVEKKSGCNHMTCSCGYEFCYICGSPHSSCQCTGGNAWERNPLYVLRRPT